VYRVNVRVCCRIAKLNFWCCERERKRIIILADAALAAAALAVAVVESKSLQHVTQRAILFTNDRHFLLLLLLLLLLHHGLTQCRHFRMERIRVLLNQYMLIFLQQGAGTASFLG
jgi:hypothetical protein